MSAAGSMTGHRRALLLALGAAIGLPILTVAGLVSGAPSPDGPFIVSLSVLTLTNALVGGAEVGTIGATLTLIAVMAGFLIAVASVVVRYRRSRGVERAQVTWLVAAVTLTAAMFVASYAIDIGSEGVLDLPSVLVSCLVPIAIGIAVLRYHLYDIDRLAERSRDEVDLERLLEVLVQTTGTAVRPSASSVWLRPMHGAKG